MKELEHLGTDRLEALSEDTLSRSKKRKLKVEIISMLISLGCILVGLIYPLIFPGNQVVAPLFYTIGFFVEGIPVFISAVKGVLTRDMTNAMEILVAIAILAC
ncbi:MAG: hypothetical protein IK088_00530, partial [Lachnospiraceae bacterium]|nr:hypothetical protein [Lachnospiraceae bacterium]